MDITFVCIGLALMALFYIMEKKVMHSGTQQYILSKLSHNKNKGLALLAELENLIGNTGAGGYSAFPGNDITYDEYLDIVREKFTIEYADTEFEKLSTRQLSRRQMRDYFDKLNSQEDTIKTLQADLATCRKSVAFFRPSYAS